MKTVLSDWSPNLMNPKRIPSQWHSLLKSFFLTALTVFAVFGLSAQTPEYDNVTGTPTGGNSIPFSWNAAGVRGQMLFPAGVFTDPSNKSAPGGKAIKTLYIYPTSGTFSSPVIYTKMDIKIGQPNITTLSTAWTTTGMKTVVSASNYAITGGMSQWCEVPLTIPFNFNPKLPLVVDVAWPSQSPFNTYYIANTTATGAARSYATPSTSTSATVGANYMYIIGFDLISLGPDNAGVTALTDPNNFCAGTYDVKANISNSGTNQLDSVRINWSIDGVRQKTIKYTTLIDTSGSKSGNLANVKLGSVAFGSTPKMIKVWTSWPNGVKDTVNDDDTIEVRLRAAMSGKFTVGGTNPDYTTLTAAAKDLSDFGICGPVEFDVRAGTYSGQVSLNNVAGASATNTVTFKGAGTASTFVTHTGTSTGDMATWLVNGVDYFTLRDMTISGLNSSYGVPLMVTGGSDYGKYDNLRLLASTSATSSYSTPLAVTGNSSSTNTYGESGNYNTFDSIYMEGGYWGLTLMGNTTTSPGRGNSLTNSEITQPYYYGIYGYYQDEVKFDNNIVHNIRNTTNYGVNCYYFSDVTFTNNEVHGGYYGLMMPYVNYYNYTSTNKSLIANNIITCLGGPGYYTHYGYYNQYVDYLHNTFIGEHDNYMMYLYYMNNTKWYNNILQNVGSGATGYLMYIVSGTNNTFDYNLYKTTGSTLVYDETPYSNLASWKSGTSYNKNSIEATPTFGTNYRLDPLKSGYRGTDVGIIEDIDGDSRCIFAPSIGADESAYPTPKTRAFFAVNDTIFVNSATQFNNQAKKGDPLVHEWYVDGSYASNDVDMIQKFSATGTYEVMLVSEGCGGLDTFKKDVVVIIPTSAPKVDFFASSRTIDVNESIIFTNLTTNGPDSFYWSVDSYFMKDQFGFKTVSHQYINKTDSNSLNPEIEFNFPGSFTICLEAFNVRGSQKVCKTFHINVIGAEVLCSVSDGSKRNTGKLQDEGGANGSYQPNRKCTYLIDPCANVISLTFNQFELGAGTYLRIYDGRDNTGTPLYNYDIAYANGLVGKMSDPSFKKVLIANSGEVYVEFESGATTGPGFELYWESKEITNPVPTVAAFNIPDTVCAGVPLVITGSADGDDVDYGWYMDTSNINAFNGYDYDTKEIVHTYNFDGQYAIRQVVTGCSGIDSITKTIWVVKPTKAPVSSFTLDNNRPSIGDAVSFKDASTTGNFPCISSWEWSVNRASFSFVSGYDKYSRNPKILFSDTGCYDITLKVTNSAGSDSYTAKCGVFSISTCLPSVKITGTDVGISRVAIGQIDNSSTIDDNGYTDYTSTHSTILEIGAGYDITIERPTPITNSMNRAVWIDYNQDGAFDNTELVAKSSADNGSTWTGKFSIPTTAIQGPTRLRVGVNLGTFKQYGCGPNQFGEFEDYRVYITEDRQAPIIVFVGAQDTTIEQCATWTDPGASGLDNVDGVISLTSTLSGVDMTTAGTYTIVYKAEDKTGNEGTGTRTVRVTADATAPVITLNGTATMDVEVKGTYTEPGYTATDNCGKVDGADVVVTGTVDVSTLGSYTISYYLVDDENNDVTVTRTVNVVDTEAPVVTLNGNAIDSIEVFSTYTELDGSAIDNYYTGLTIKIAGKVNTNLIGMYELKYTSTDGSGNTSQEVVRTVYVVDRTAPELRLAQGIDTTITIDVWSKYTPEYVDIDDNYYSEASIRPTLTKGGTYVSSFGSAAANMLGDYTFTYTANDGSNNFATATRNIKVADREAPTMVFTNGASIVIKRWTEFDANKIAYEVDDNFDEDADLTVTVLKNNVDQNAVGVYQVEYQIEDLSGNKGTFTLDVVVANDIANSLTSAEIIADIYPNPTNGELNIIIDIAGADRARVSIINSLGQEVLVIAEKATSNINTTADLSTLSAGVYNVQIVTNSQRIVKKVTVTE